MSLSYQSIKYVIDGNKMKMARKNVIILHTYTYPSTSTLVVVVVVVL